MKSALRLPKLPAVRAVAASRMPKRDCARASIVPANSRLIHGPPNFPGGSEIACTTSRLISTGLGRASKLKHLWQAPFTLHRNVVRAIHAETAHAEAGRAAKIVAKMNALLEPEVIAALYQASKAGVQIDLIVRGVCALRPGMPGVSDNIRVRSVIGRFLEHSRVFYFLNGGKDDVYLSSADWMGRNFFGRVEVSFPVLDAALKQRVISEGLTPYLECAAQAWIMDQHGAYHAPPADAAADASAQTRLLSALSE